MRSFRAGETRVIELAGDLDLTTAEVICGVAATMPFVDELPSLRSPSRRLLHRTPDHFEHVLLVSEVLAQQAVELISSLRSSRRG